MTSRILQVGNVKVNTLVAVVWSRAPGLACSLSPRGEESGACIRSEQGGFLALPILLSYLRNALCVHNPPGCTDTLRPADVTAMPCESVTVCQWVHLYCWKSLQITCIKTSARSLSPIGMSLCLLSIFLLHTLIICLEWYKLPFLSPGRVLTLSRLLLYTVCQPRSYLPHIPPVCLFIPDGWP